jgi:hypothetical protein
LLRRLESADVRDIVFDVDFSTPSDAATDQAFADALRSAGGSVVLPSFKQPRAYGGDATAVHINRPLKLFGDHSWPAVCYRRLCLPHLPACASSGIDQMTKADPDGRSP